MNLCQISNNQIHMANKREFKKYVEALGASVCEEMMVAYYNVDGIDTEKVGKAIQTVLGAVGLAKINSNVHFDRGHKAFEDRSAYGKARSEFFRQLFNKISMEFSGAIDEALKLFNSAIPAQVREANKKMAE